jgi:hypothetical protein
VARLGNQVLPLTPSQEEKASNPATNCKKEVAKIPSAKGKPAAAVTGPSDVTAPPDKPSTPLRTTSLDSALTHFAPHQFANDERLSPRERRAFLLSHSLSGKIHFFENRTGFSTISRFFTAKRCFYW